MDRETHRLAFELTVEYNTKMDFLLSHPGIHKLVKFDSHTVSIEALKFEAERRGQGTGEA